MSNPVIQQSKQLLELLKNAPIGRIKGITGDHGDYLIDINSEAQFCIYATTGVVGIWFRDQLGDKGFAATWIEKSQSCGGTSRSDRTLTDVISSIGEAEILQAVRKLRHAIGTYCQEQYNEIAQKQKELLDFRAKILELP